MTEPIAHAVAVRIARAHGCVRCGEYSYKKVKVKPANAEHTAELKEVWHAQLLCGVCGAETELGIDAEGDVLYAS